MPDWLRNSVFMAFAAVAALALVEWTCGPRVLAHSGDEVDADEWNPDAPRTVSAETAKFIGLKSGEAAMRPLSESIQLTGRVKFPPENRRKVCARLSGKVVSIARRIGEAAEAGDVVAEIESPEVIRSQLEGRRYEAEHQRLLLEIEKAKVEAEGLKRTVRVSELQYDAQQKELKRTETQNSTAPMAALELASRQENVVRSAGDLRINKLQLDLTETTVANLTRQAEAMLEISKIQLSLGRSENGLLKLRADARGTVAARPAVLGEWVQTGQVLLEICDTSSVQIEADVPESQIARVRAGASKRASIRPLLVGPMGLGGSGGSGGGAAIAGVAGVMGPSIDAVRRTATLYVDAVNADNALLENAWVSVSLALSEPHERLAVPRAAVLTRGPQRFVFVKNGQTFQKQDVATGIGDGDWVEITAGLAPGDTIVTQGAEALLHLRPGQAAHN